MKTKVQRIFTPLLFLSLVALFVTYKSGYFQADEPADLPVRRLSGASFNQASYAQESALQEMLISSSKSITATDHSEIARLISLSMLDIRSRPLGSLMTDPTKDITSDELLATSISFLNDSTVSLDQESREMAHQLDSLTRSKWMLMVSSKSLISVDQTRLADSLELVLIKALRLRVDSLKRNQNQ
jgi:hypothetical protein